MVWRIKSFLPRPQHGSHPFLAHSLLSSESLSPHRPSSPVGCCRESFHFGPSVYEKHFDESGEKGGMKGEQCCAESGRRRRQTIMCIFGVIVTSLSSFVDSLVHCYLDFFLLHSPLSCWFGVWLRMGFFCECSLLLYGVFARIECHMNARRREITSKCGISYAWNVALAALFSAAAS